MSKPIPDGHTCGDCLRLDWCYGQLASLVSGRTKCDSAVRQFHPSYKLQRDALLKACKAMKSDLEHYPDSKGYDSIAMAESAIAICEKEGV